ncbi:CobD/CbiB family protein [Propionivibrio sp.]|uniref:CobD/CbiB family protein n=1 Tax=Propionivibrio sp. TaxID=2212460 RepID=UPI00261A3E18|nr:CobD/CbiB family protein [Propionivibrio sp.]
MALFSLVAVLLIEQIRPLPYRLVVHEPLSRLARFLEGLFNAGESSHGLIAWLVAVGGLVVVAGSVHAVLYALNPLLAWLWNVLVLYLTMGFRQFSHYYTDIQLALRMDDLPHARKLLAEWRGRTADELSSSEIARIAIEEALSASHRHVFGVLVCFVLLPMPCGAVLYRAAAFFADQWGRRSDADAGHFGKFSQQAFAVIDWLPLRVTAAGFAIVGNFEDAIYCWRTQADKWPDSHLGGGIGIVLASGAGALGVRLGMPVLEAGEIADRAEVGTGDEADVDFMQSAVGLVWRALLLWLLLLLLLGMASLIGS